MIKNYKDLNVWQLSRSLVKDIYLITEELPKHEQFGLISQIRRASVSVPSNIAEGHSRTSTKDYIRFISMAIGSLAELETQLILCCDLGYVELADNQYEKIYELQRMLHGLRKKLNEQATP